MNLDKFFLKVYDKNNYNCAHFVADVWKEITGEDITWKLSGFLRPKTERTVSRELARIFTRVPYSSKELSIVLMQRAGHTPHVGILHNGRIFQLTELGAEYSERDVACRGFQRVRYYK